MIPTNNLVTYPFYKPPFHEDYLIYQKENNLSEKEAITRVNIGLNKPFYTNAKEINNLDCLTILVNKYRYLPKDYVPNNLTQTKEYAKSLMRLNIEAYEQFRKMAADAYKEDSFKLRIVSAYRSYHYQEKLYNNYLKYDSQDKVDTYSARPGHSEHQTGLAADINYAGDWFNTTPEARWLAANSWKYGFIIRYPAGKESITGYKYESWHVRYLGEELAKLVYNSGLTLEEYLGIDSKYTY